MCRNARSIADKKRERDAGGRYLPGPVFSGDDEECTPTQRLPSSRGNKRYTHDNGKYHLVLVLRLGLRADSRVTAIQDDSPSASRKRSKHGESSNTAPSEENRTVRRAPASKEAKRIMRQDLAILLYRELRHKDDRSNANIGDAKSMLAKSKDLDSMIKTVRTQGEDGLRAALGVSYEQDLQILDDWLAWRQGCWLLSEATGVSLILRE